MIGVTPERYYISGICCSTEESVLRRKLDAIVGPEHYTYNPLTSELILRRSPGSAIVQAEVTRSGFGIRESRDIAEEESGWPKYRELGFIGVSIVLAVCGIVAEAMVSTPIVSRGLLLLSIVLGGWRVFVKAWHSARSFSLDMNFLMAIAVLGAIAIDKWAEGAAVIVLFGLSLVLESMSMKRTRRAVLSLMATAPPEATVVRDGKEFVAPSATIQVGETILIRPGERVPLDGKVTSGRSTVDQSAISGESMPVLKEEGAVVFAGSVNERGALRVRVSRVADDSMIARIVHLVEEAQQKKAPVQMFVERCARIYTPAVVLLAALTALLPPLLLEESFSGWFYKALTLLVIACPCALVISTPVTIVSAITRAARMGLLVKGGRQLEVLSKVKAVAFDKTGTLTEGKPRVTDIVALNSMGREEILRLAAALELHSEHHVASAILTEAAIASVQHGDVSVEQFESVPGRGIEGVIDGNRYFLGNLEFCEEKGFCSPRVRSELHSLTTEGKTAIVFGKKGEAIAVLGLRDTARGESAAVVERLREAGVEHMVIISGDRHESVSNVAREVGLAHTLSAQLPEQKLRAIEDLRKRYGVVAMVGDGVNDAPALAAASVGIAMGFSGTDAALESADVVIMSDDIGKVSTLLQLSSKAMAVVRQNIAFALTIKAVFLILSYAGLATLWMAVLADDGAAVVVILNGLRLLAYSPAE